MTRLRIFLVSLCGLLMAGCMNFGDAPGAIEAPVQAVEPNLFIYRRPAFFLDDQQVVLVLDGVDIGKIRINEFVELGVTDGSHVLGARCATSNRPLTRDWRLVEFSLRLDYGETVFVELGPCQFRERPAHEAEQEIQNYTYRPLRDGIEVQLRKWLEERRGALGQ